MYGETVNPAESDENRGLVEKRREMLHEWLRTLDVAPMVPEEYRWQV